MNNNTFTPGAWNPKIGGGTPQFVDFSKVRSQAEVSKEKAAANNNNNNNNGGGNSDTDKIASELGNRMLRDLGAFMLNPVKGSFDFNKQMFKEALGAPFRLMNQGQQKTEEPAVEEPKAEEPKVEEPKVEEPKVEDTETIEYTYKDGDTFGQVIKDLGLESGNGLWGDNGDVNYYTQQLIDQGIWSDGVARNIPIGTTIRLKRRPLTQEMIEYRNQYGYN